MAILYGESGAWNDARAPLQKIGLYPEDPTHLRELIGPLEQAWLQSETDAANSL